MTDGRQAAGVREARLQVAMSVLATGLLALGLYLGEALRAGPGAECREDVQCAEGEVCLGGRCRVPPSVGPLPCQEGDPCAGCVCGAGNQCDAEDRCMPEAEDACTPEVVKMIAEIRDFERERCKAVGTDATQCDPQALDRFVLEHDRLNALLLGLQSTITVHFDQNQPNAEGGLSRATQGWYAGHFQRLGDRLRQAKLILIFGRSSRDRATTPSRIVANNNLAQNRMQQVAQWIVELGTTPQERDELTKRLVRLSLGERQPLTREQLAGNPRHQFVAWRKSREDLLVAEVRGAAPPDAGKQELLARALNQSVLVVPVMCEVP
jgi:hypothetical protein